MRLLLTALLLSSCLLEAKSVKPEPQLLTETEASELVASQEKAKAKQKANFKAFLKSAKAIEEHSFYKDGRRILHRRVKSSKKSRVAPVEAKKEDVQELQNLSELLPEEYRSEMISFSANNYDDLYSEITWRDGKNVFSVWANVALVHLPALNSFQLDEVHYSYFGFTNNIDSAVEKERAGPHYFNGQTYEYQSRWKESPVAFGEEPEYVVIPETEGLDIPEKLYEDMDAVLGYYLESEDSLRISHLNSQTLNRVRAKYLEENPPPPEESVLIYSFKPSGE